MKKLFVIFSILLIVLMSSAITAVTAVFAKNDGQLNLTDIDEWTRLDYEYYFDTGVAKITLRYPHDPKISVVQVYLMGRILSKDVIIAAYRFLRGDELFVFGLTNLGYERKYPIKENIMSIKQDLQKQKYMDDDDL